MFYGGNQLYSITRKQHLRHMENRSGLLFQRWKDNEKQLDTATAKTVVTDGNGFSSCARFRGNTFWH